MANYINQDDLIYFLQKILHDHINDNDNEDIVVKAFIERMIKFIEKFPTTDIQFKNGIIYINERSMIKKGDQDNE